MSAPNGVLDNQVANLHRSSSRLWVAILAVLLVVSFGCLAYPVYVIRPFRAQGPRELAVALVVLQYRIAVAGICAVSAIGALAAYWRVPSPRWKRAAFGAGSLAVCAFAALCYVNVYELMFRPNTRPAFSPAAQTKLEGDEKVIAVRAGSSARAYPIRSISYHHIINDVVAGVPIAATY